MTSVRPLVLVSALFLSVFVVSARAHATRYGATTFTSEGASELTVVETIDIAREAAEGFDTCRVRFVWDVVGTGCGLLSFYASGVQEAPLEAVATTTDDWQRRVCAVDGQRFESVFATRLLWDVEHERPRRSRTRFRSVHRASGHFPPIADMVSASHPIFGVTPEPTWNGRGVCDVLTVHAAQNIDGSLLHRGAQPDDGEEATHHAVVSVGRNPLRVANLSIGCPDFVFSVGTPLLWIGPSLVLRLGPVVRLESPSSAGFKFGARFQFPSISLTLEQRYLFPSRERAFGVGL